MRATENNGINYSVVHYGCEVHVFMSLICNVKWYFQIIYIQFLTHALVCQYKEVLFLVWKQVQLYISDNIIVLLFHTFQHLKVYQINFDNISGPQNDECENIRVVNGNFANEFLCFKLVNDWIALVEADLAKFPRGPLIENVLFGWGIQ